MSHQTLSQIYGKLSRADLVFLLGVRELDTAGTPSELIERLANNELSLFPAAYANFDAIKAKEYSIDKTVRLRESRYQKKAKPRADQVGLPPELWMMIIKYTNDWELSAALFLSDTCIRKPAVWDFATETDLAILHDDLPHLKRMVDKGLKVFPIPKHVIDVVLRFEYIDILEFIWKHMPSTFTNDQIPLLASRYNSPKVLQWWKQTNSPENLFYSESCLDAASSSRHTEALDWWRDSGLPLKIGRVLDFASDEGDVAVLEWWRTSGLKFKYSKLAMRHASQNGHISVLDWWLNSGLQLFYDAGCLDYATRFNRVAVLEWWFWCGLMIEYRIMDIEEALGEAVVGGNECRNWWVDKGIDFGVNNSDWMKDRILNEQAQYRHA
ncbi:Putative uncharacterized protein [Taphrina deformans PYCC 5710]|uniref:Ankyrin repeat protein n=1 Tax=Taphrina deformans (strain PYCC 5710 / ATCC 11124 / CBS 356.35 / IMI 108563 / JCM 9778 / NBRC 8474) TaxID=1097556 RepID=R4X7M5_TAPDE|nr:Putative uncharacterized protein [Taphrina deformans PYCC 5710]|eukprot:CCG81410.1 Putative uncharacterized protein [Taphrina deformans PYCC 5710]